MLTRLSSAVCVAVVVALVAVAFVGVAVVVVWLLLVFLLLADLFGRHIGPNVCEKDQNGRWLGGRGLSLILSLFAVVAALLLFLSLRRVRRSRERS